MIHCTQGNKSPQGETRARQSFFRQCMRVIKFKFRFNYIMFLNGIDR